MFTAALFTIAKTWKQPKCPLRNEWIKKMCGTYIQCNVSLEPDILECKVKGASGSIAMNKASEGDRIPAELF